MIKNLLPTAKIKYEAEEVPHYTVREQVDTAFPSQPFLTA